MEGRYSRGWGGGGRSGSRSRGGSLVIGVVALGIPDGDDARVREEAVHVADELFVSAPVSILALSMLTKLLLRM